MRYISVDIYADYYQLSPETVRRMCREGKILGAVQPGGYAGSWRIPIEALKVTEKAEIQAHERKALIL
jgi:hypothetical protein